MSISGLSSNIAASGMQAATQRIQAAASNTANRDTEGFQRRRVEQSEATAGGGVQARIERTDARNDDTGAAVSDALEAHQAAQDFAANANAFRAREDALGTLLNVLA